MRGSAPEVVVIGAGLGGLVAAALLARAGRSVLVVERHSVAGGSATIFARRGYEFDVGLHYIGGCQPGGPLRRLLDAAGAEDVRFVPLDPDGYDHYLFPDLSLRVPVGLEAWRARLLEHFPSEQRGLDRYFALLRQLQRALRVFHDGPALARAILRSPTLLRWSRASLADFLAACTGDARLRAVLAAQHVGYALPPSRASVLVGAGIALHYLEGAYYPRGGGQVLADALVRSIERHGGEVLLRTSVTRIAVEARRRTAVSGVELEDARGVRRFLPVRQVLCNGDLKHALTALLPPEALSGRTLRRTQNYEMAPALAVLSLGVARDLRAEGQPRANLWIAPSWEAETEYAAAAAGRFPERAAAFLTIASVKDPEHLGLAPPGHSNLQIMSVTPSAPAAWGVSAAQLADGSYRREPAYRAAKERCTEQLLDTAERALPGLRGHVVLRELASPLTQVRYTASSGGTAYGLAATPEQFLWRRPGARTEIDGLLLCGASCRTGHGIVGAALSGLYAAAEVVPGKLRHAVLG
ncbi:MAG: phytoene desaturase family protein [Planctomycetota bacterium]